MFNKKTSQNDLFVPLGTPCWEQRAEHHLTVALLFEEHPSEAKRPGNLWPRYRNHLGGLRYEKQMKNSLFFAKKRGGGVALAE